MTAQIEYIWQMEPYQHVKWTGTAEEWDKETAESLTALGQQWYAAKTCVLAGRDNPDILPEADAQELIERELGGKVISVTENQPVAEDKPWKVKIDTPPNEWEQPTAAPVKPTASVPSGLEDF